MKYIHINSSISIMRAGSQSVFILFVPIQAVYVGGGEKKKKKGKIRHSELYLEEEKQCETEGSNRQIFQLQAKVGRIFQCISVSTVNLNSVCVFEDHSFLQVTEITALDRSLFFSHKAAILSNQLSAYEEQSICLK